MEGYLKILGLSSNFTLEDLKKAYKQKAKLFHPDRNNGNDEMFKKISEANIFLMNYIESQKENLMGDLNEKFEYIFGQTREEYLQKKFSKQVKNIDIGITSLNEMIKSGGRVINLKFDKTICSSCDGDGFSQKKECYYCRGFGKTKVEESLYGRQTIGASRYKYVDCHCCMGKKYIFEKKCTRCMGLGYIDGESIYEVKISAIKK